MSLRIKHLKTEDSRTGLQLKWMRLLKESLDEIKVIRESLKKDFQKSKKITFAISPEVQLQQMTKVNRILAKPRILQ